MDIEWDGTEPIEMTIKQRWVTVALALVPAIVLAVCLYGSAQKNQGTIPDIEAGVLNLQNWDRDAEPIFRLSGEWQISPNQLLKSDQIENNTDSTILHLPIGIKSADIYGQPLPEYDSATYYIRVTNVSSNKLLGIRIGEMTSAYRLYIDNQLVAVNGLLTDNALAPISTYPLQTVAIPPGKEDFNLILQTANNCERRGLIQWPLEFGVYNELIGEDQLRSTIHLLTVGGLLAISLLLLLFTVIVPWKKESLLLAFFGIVTLTLLLDSHYVLAAHLIPLMPLALLNKLHFLSSYACWLLMMVSMAVVFPKSFPRWFTIPLSIIFTGLLIYIAAVPLLTFHGMDWPDAVSALICCGCLVFVARAVLDRKPGAPVMLALLGCLATMLIVYALTGDSSLFYNFFTGSGLIYGCFILTACIIVSHDYIEARNMELNALKDQIRPHFVHNALASIISISRKDPDRSRDLLIDFSNYLRGRFDFLSTEYISIKQELEFIRSYVTLEKARMDDKIEIQYQIEATNIFIPPLILQPLVENALVHGLRANQDKIIVVVYTQFIDHKSVRIGVRDNGPGLQPGTTLCKARLGIALANINRRLSRIYDAELRFRIPAGGGCDVYMEIPCKEAEQ